MYVGQKIDRLTITKLIGRGSKVEELCDCGNIWNGYLDIRNKTQCCKECRLPKIGEKYNKLTIIEVLSRGKVKF